MGSRREGGRRATKTVVDKWAVVVMVVVATGVDNWATAVVVFVMVVAMLGK